MKENKIIIAIDTSEVDLALDLAKEVKDCVFSIKLGLEFWNANGKEGIKKFNQIGINNLMLDLKLKDIPQTVYKSIKALNDINFSFLTIHGTGGKNMIQKAKQAASEIKSKPNIMMVTVLTSIDENEQKNIGNINTTIKQVEQLSKIAKELEVNVVCSGQEVKLVRKIIGSKLLIFTPGIRMSEDTSDDQKRICTPYESIKNGADKIIMGRSLVNGDIKQNIIRVQDSLKK